MLLPRVLVFLLSLAIAATSMLSATRTFLLPRGARDPVTRVVFRAMRRLFDLLLFRTSAYHARDRVMALYAPISLLALDAVWLALTLLGFTGMFWALGAPDWPTAFAASGSGLLTLGFAPIHGISPTALTFAEAVIGLTQIALLISYLPTIYSAFSRRESAVTLLEVRAGSPPSPLTMIERFYRIQGLHRLHDMWVTWEAWFGELEETHTSLAALSFFRSPSPDRSWITAAGTVLDAAALYASTLDMPRDAQADLCIRAGFVALRHIADFFGIPYDPDPAPGDPISIARVEFDAAYDRLAGVGVPLKPDREQAWHDFAGWRVNYDTVLLALAGLTMAPPGALWSTDRANMQLRLSVFSAIMPRPVRQPKRRASTATHR